MRKKLLIWASVMVSGVLASAAVATSPDAVAKVQWRHDYRAAIQEAKRRNLSIVIEFSSPNCYWCDKQKTTTFRDPFVVKAINHYFVPVKLTAEDYPEIAEALKIDGYPTMVFANSTGRVLGRQIGYVDVPGMKRKLKKTLVAAGQLRLTVRQAATARR